MRREESDGERLSRVTIQGLFFIVGSARRALLHGGRNILQDVFGISKEYFPSPESHKGEEEEDGPSDADEDDHDGVPHDEPRQVEDIRQDTDDGDETHIRKPKTQIRNHPRREKWKREAHPLTDKENLRERPATKNLAEMFMEFEPVREDSKQEQKGSKAKQHHCGHNAHSIPNLSGGRRHESMERQAKDKNNRYTNVTTEVAKRRHVHFPSVLSESEEGECRKS